jgi:hypothetical protein
VDWDLPFTLQDKGYHFLDLDQNRIRMSQYLMLLLFAAMDAIHDKEARVDWPTVDVITNRNGCARFCALPSSSIQMSPAFAGRARLEAGSLRGHHESDIITMARVMVRRSDVLVTVLHVP